MCLKALHALASQPRVYNWIQRMAGADEIHRRLAARSEALRASGPTDCVLDVGGGTGIYSKLWQGSRAYICLDYDWQKLQGFIKADAGGVPLQADATRMPIRDHTLDVVVCTAVTHHLTETMVEAALSEMMRVLKPSGRLLLLDAVWNPARRLNNLLWKYDRGSSPHPLKWLDAAVAARGRIVYHETFSVYHQYAIWIAEPRGAP